MARTLRKQITAYVTPELKQQLAEMLASSDHNRETESSLVERLVKGALERELSGGRPIRRAHGAPRRSV